jgi:hypothetical protein
MSRKRKSVAPRRLDAAAREEHNWEASKDDINEPAPVLAPAALAEGDDDVQVLAHTGKPPVAGQDILQEPSEEDNHRTQEKQFAKTLNKLQQLYEQDFPRAAKKPRKTITISFTIPFNKSKDGKFGGGDYVELTNITVNCDTHNEEFYACITEGMIDFLYNSSTISMVNILNTHKSVFPF